MTSGDYVLCVTESEFRVRHAGRLRPELYCDRGEAHRALARLKRGRAWVDNAAEADHDEA